MHLRVVRISQRTEALVTVGSALDHIMTGVRSDCSILSSGLDISLREICDGRLASYIEYVANGLPKRGDKLRAIF